MGYRGRALRGLLGDVDYERAYYHCPHCEEGWFPTDEELRVSRGTTPGALQAIALVGALNSFEEAAHKVLHCLAGLSVSASTVQRITESTGDDVARRRAAGETFGPSEPWKWQPDATGKGVAYLSLDATGVPQQGIDKKKVEGRMPWVGAVFNPWNKQGRRPGRRQQARYVSGLMSLDEIGAQLRRECEQVGVRQAEVIVALTDGGNGLEECLLKVAAGLGPKIEFILDFFHAKEHLREFARAFIPGEDERRNQVEQWRLLLKSQGGEALVKTLKALDLSAKPTAVEEARANLLGYFERNLHRMDYPRYLANGWQIGSGTIESACKTVVGQRLKASGMRWREYGTTAMCQLRALLRSTGLWENYWLVA